MSKTIKSILSTILYMVVLIAITVLFIRFVMQRTQVVLGVYVAPEQQDLTDTIQDALNQEEEAQ